MKLGLGFDRPSEWTVAVVNRFQLGKYIRETNWLFRNFVFYLCLYETYYWQERGADPYSTMLVLTRHVTHERDAPQRPTGLVPAWAD